MSAVHALAGARIKRIDGPRLELFAFTLSSHETRGVLLASFAANARGIGLVDARPSGLPASAFVRKLRKELEGGVLLDVLLLSPHVVQLRVRRGEEEHSVVLDFGKQPNVLLLDAQARVIVGARPHGDWSLETTTHATYRGKVAWGETLEELRALGPSLLETASDSQLDALREALARGVRTAEKRLLRRHEAISGEVERAALAPKLRADAALLMAHLGQVPRGAASVRLLDYTQDPPAHVELALDPAEGAREQAEAWFHKARRFERGAMVATRRLQLAEREQAYLERLREAISAATELADLTALEPRARALGVRAQQGSGSPIAANKRAKQAPKPPYREMRGDRDRTILVGRGAAHNDELTLRHAKPHDLWLHARDTSGAHVVVPLTRGESCPPELLRDAALLAAHFSGFRGEPIVDVIYAERRYIRKPKGSAPGSVTVDREKVFRLHLDEPRLKHLLASELPDI